MKPPCGKKCSDRSAECKLSCGKWKDYEEKKFKEYEEREKERHKMEDCIVLEVRRNDRMVKR